MDYNLDFYSTIGSDEVGTGDFFGPITVCAVYIDKKDVARLKALGLRDSKNLTDVKITEIAKILIREVKYALTVLDNTKYNQVVKTNNMNQIKAKLHNHAILALIDKLGFEPEQVVVDEFASRENYFGYLKNEKKVYYKIKSYTKAESKSLAVAAASIIARYAFIKTFDELAVKVGYPLLKGASNKVDELAAVMIKQKGQDYLTQCAKMNFKNLEKAKNLL